MASSKDMDTIEAILDDIGKREQLMIDLTEAETVEVLVIHDKLWINVDGVCRLRIGKVKELAVQRD